jgi:hypothetical protein
MGHLSVDNRAGARKWSIGIHDGSASSETIEFDLLAFANRFHVLFFDLAHLCCFSLGSRLGYGPYDCAASTESVRSRLVLWLLDLGNLSNLVKISFEHSRIRNVLGGFGELE